MCVCVCVCVCVCLLLSQRPSILRGTIGSNIALGVAGAEASAESVEAAARTVEAHEWISALPLGYDTPVMADDDESDDDVGHNSYHGASATSSGLRRRRRHLDSDASGDMRLPFAKRRQLHDDDDEEEVRLTLVQRQFIGLARIAIKKPRICLLGALRCVVLSVRPPPSCDSGCYAPKQIMQRATCLSARLWRFTCV